MYHGSDHLDKIDRFESHRGYSFFTSSHSEASRYVSSSFVGQPDWDEVAKNVGAFYIKAENLFDPRNMNDKERESIYNLFRERGEELIEGIRNEGDVVEDAISDGAEEDYFSLCAHILEKMCDNYLLLEHDIVQKWIRTNNYDSFSTIESGDGFNIAVYNSNQIKSINNENFSHIDNIFEHLGENISDSVKINEFHSEGRGEILGTRV